MPTLGERLKNSWNAFLGRDPTHGYNVYEDYGAGSGYRVDRVHLTRGNARSIIAAIYNRISMDVASLDFEHVQNDSDGNYLLTIDSRLNNCLTLETNVDQIANAFIQDVCLSMFDEGCIAIVPTDTTIDPKNTESFDILEMRTGKIVEWYPLHVKINVYNEIKGRREDIMLPKAQVAIIENPLYAVMNEPNSTLQRLLRTLATIDKINETNTNGKLDLIVQLPYVNKTKQQIEQAEKRRQRIVDQLTNSQYGIAYIDGTEHVTQLNRPVENNLWTQAKDLMEQVFGQLGLSQAILDGTADEKAMMNYYSRTIDPIAVAISKEMKRKFLSKNARTRGQDIKYFRDPFRLTPVSEFSSIADTLTRNAILSSNEVRAAIGYKPVDDARADELSNKNISQSAEEAADPMMVTEERMDETYGNEEM